MFLASLHLLERYPEGLRFLTLCNRTLTNQFEAWRELPLLAHYHILYLDGIHFTVRRGTQTDSTIIFSHLL